jgi:uncharacterized membrane protein
MIPSSIIVKKRFEELDFARGMAILLMIAFHLIVDLKDFYSYNLEYLQGFWYVEGKLSAVLFIFLCGLSSTLSHNSTRHGITIFIWAMLLTTISYAYNADFYIRFGILHLLGISLLLTPILHSLQKRWLLLVSAVSLFVGLLVSARYIASPFLFPLGLQTSTFTSLDYYPLFPWYGVFVAGVIAGKQFYARKQPLFSIPFPKTITWLGRHSLAIYLIHQPILVAFLYIIHRA